MAGLGFPRFCPQHQENIPGWLLLLLLVPQNKAGRIGSPLLTCRSDLQPEAYPT